MRGSFGSCSAFTAKVASTPNTLRVWVHCRRGRAVRCGDFTFLKLGFGLRLADGTDMPLPVACSVLVRVQIVGTDSGASYLLRRAEDEGIVWFVEALEPLGKPYGTKTWLPGPRPMGPEPRGGWRVQPLSEFFPVGVEGPAPAAARAGTRRRGWRGWGRGRRTGPGRSRAAGGQRNRGRGR